MNQQCKVCGEPAAGFHFGAFTCEGCKSFFGRSYNNLNSITECKNNGECIINKKNRTACKSCRLRKCLLVGMSKSGSRYGRRSNWFKIHCLLQEQQQAAVAQMKGKNASTTSPLENPLPLLSPLAFPHPTLGTFLRSTNASSPSVSSPDSDTSEPGPYSPRLNGTSNFVNKDLYLPVPFHSMFLQPPSMTSPFLLPPSLIPFPVPPAKRTDYSQRLLSPDHVQNFHKRSSTPDIADDERVQSSSPPPRHSPTNNNEYGIKYNCKSVGSDDCKNKYNNNHNNNNNTIGVNNKNFGIKNDKVTVRSKRFYLDAILGLKDDESAECQKKKSTGDDGDAETPRTRASARVEDGKEEPEQDNPIDLSVKSPAFKDDVTSLDNSCPKMEEVMNERGGTPMDDDDVEDDGDRSEENEEEVGGEREHDKEGKSKIYKSHDELKPIPLDLTV